MRSTELHGERRGWNLHFKRRVVRCGVIFLEVWIFRDVRDQFQNFVAHHFSAAAAKREDGVAHQDHAGARLVLMAYLVNPRLLDQLSGSQRAIALIKSFNVSLVQFHDAFFLCPSFPRGAMAHGSNSAHPWDALRPATSWCVLVSQKSFADFISGNPSCGLHSSSARSQGWCDQAANSKFESL
jgi:hypothetical protein